MLIFVLIEKECKTDRAINSERQIKKLQDSPHPPTSVYLLFTILTELTVKCHKSFTIYKIFLLMLDLKIVLKDTFLT